MVKDRKEYYIPNIKLIGYGRTQTYQVECLKCKNLFFNFVEIKDLDDLFCDKCKNMSNTEKRKYLKQKNISTINYIGNIVGWELKSATSFIKRSRYNYKKVYKRDKYICQYCGYSPYYSDEFRPLHIDHIKPWSAGGSNKMENLVVACQICNSIAGSKWFDNFIDKKQYILDELRRKKIKTYFELKIKFLNKYA